MFKQESGYLLIVSGPAGSGKTTVCERMLKEVPSIERVVTSTTRFPRSGEVDTVDYYFFDHDTFQAKLTLVRFTNMPTFTTSSMEPSKVR